jgi:hypothetical protein
VILRKYYDNILKKIKKILNQNFMKIKAFGVTYDSGRVEIKSIADNLNKFAIYTVVPFLIIGLINMKVMAWAIIYAFIFLLFYILYLSSFFTFLKKTLIDYRQKNSNLKKLPNNLRHFPNNSLR